MGYRPASPIGRVLLLPLAAFAIALVFHGALAIAGIPSNNPVRVFATPIIGGLVVYFGLRDYPRSGRLRLALMVAAGLFLVALAL